MVYETKRDAAHAWVNEDFIPVPVSVAEKLMEYSDYSDFLEITPHDEDDEDFEYGLPMWSTMWAFGLRIDEDWARENLEEIGKCGFKIFESEDYGIVIGIDGAGYDFYEDHWIPLYDARGLKWHEE